MDFATFHAQLLSGPKGLFLFKAFQSIYLLLLQNSSSCTSAFIMPSSLMIALCLDWDKLSLFLLSAEDNDWQSEQTLALQMSTWRTAARKAGSSFHWWGTGTGCLKNWGIPIPGSIQKYVIWGSKQPGPLKDVPDLGRGRLELDKAPSNPHHSIILWSF